MAKHWCQTTAIVAAFLFAALFSGCLYFQADTCSLTVAVYPTLDAGRVEVTPNMQVYLPGDEVQLHAHASAGWTFTGWTGITPSTVNPVTFHLYGNMLIVANFRLLEPLPAEGEGELSIEGEGQSEIEGEEESLSCTATYPWEWEIGGQPVAYADQIIAWEQEVYDQINAIRLEHGFSALYLDTCVSRVARAHSRDMAENDYLDHVNLSGDDFGVRLHTGDVQWKSCAENIVWYPPSNENPVAPCVELWMESPSHRSNILLPSFTHTGIGIALTDDGEVYITQNFVRY